MTQVGLAGKEQREREAHLDTLGPEDTKEHLEHCKFSGTELGPVMVVNLKKFDRGPIFENKISKPQKIRTSQTQYILFQIPNKKRK